MDHDPPPPSDLKRRYLAFSSVEREHIFSNAAKLGRRNDWVSGAFTSMTAAATTSPKGWWLEPPGRGSDPSGSFLT